MGLQSSPQDAAAVEARAAAAGFYLEMDAVLADREFLAGSFSYADIAFFMASLFGERMGAEMSRATPALLAWRDRVAARPAVRQVGRTMMDYLASIGRPVPAFMTVTVAG
jgi:glutathione S-transferase